MLVSFLVLLVSFSDLCLFYLAITSLGKRKFVALLKLPIEAM